jgi:1-acyl-sn-glycerol-3-phosphate acyltransferase
METGQALPADTEDSTALRFVSCGQPLPAHKIRIVNEQGRELPERHEGRLEFQGPSCTSGYFRNPAATRRLYHDDWLDSGDKAYIAAGDVYITGRVKDVIIRGGRNIYPYELEQAIGEIPGIRHGNVVAFASPDPATGTERLVIVAESQHTTPAARASLQQQVHAATVDLLDAPPDDVVLVPPRSILKTSSGKLRRVTMRERYERGELESTPKARWRQFARFGLAAIGPQLRRLLHRGGNLAYAGYAWTLFATVGLIVWTAVVLLPRLDWRWTVVHGAARGLGHLAGTGLTVQGLEHLHSTKPCVLVANHASYLDSIVLAAALPRYFRFIAKRELMAHPVIRLPLQRLGTVFIERFDLQRSATEAQQIAQLVQAGQPLAFFPEGTFYPLPGLLPFRMGAFVAAAQAGVPVVPVTICGTRTMLRSGSWFPHRAALWVVVEKPIFPAGNDWQAAVTLRDATRAVMLRHSKEPDLAR